MRMNHPTYRFWIGAGLAVMLVLSVSSARGYAEREGGESSRQDQLKQEAQASAGEIKTLLTAILQQANQNLRPEPSVIEQAATLLEDSKRSASAYDETQKAEYMLLQAWTEFYAGRLPGAVNWSLRACKTDEASQDAWISQALFSQLSGKRPVEPKIQRPEAQPERGNERDGMNRRPTPQPRRRANENTVTRADVVPYSRKGTLEFDVQALRGDMLKERLTRFTYTSSGATAVEYKPGEDTLCAFIWQAEPSISDANDLSGGQTARAAERLNGGYTEDSQGLSLENQQKYVSTVFAACQGQEQITMLQLNTNDRRTAEQLSRTHAAGDNMPPLVFAADPDSGAGAFGRVEARVAFLLIADNTGVVRYAGPAKGFMPAFILSHLTGVSIPLSGGGQSRPAEGMNGLRGEFEMGRPGPRGIMPRIIPTVPPADPNGPAASDPNAVSAAPVRPRSMPRPIPAAEEPGMPLQDQVTAEKLLEGAKIEIEACRTIRGKSPAKGVTACKTVLEKYPGTPYAEQAKDLLRKVPERYWKDYGIADILGY
jgi:hypothetical protein